jgi:hypothetical protein
MKNRSIILSSLACLLFSTVVTYQKPAHAQIHIPAPVVSAPTLATMAGLYAFAYYGKGWVKKLSESNVAYVSGVEKLDEYNALRALAKMEDSGFWALVSFVLYDAMILRGYPAATANAVVAAFTAGLTGSLMFVDVPARFITWYKTFTSAQAAGTHGYARMHDVPNTTRLDCGPLNESCKYEQPKNGTVAQNHADEFSLLPSRETMTNLLYDFGLMYIGYHAGLSAYKAGKAYSTAAVTAYVPNFTDREIYQAEEYMKIVYVVRKMLGKMIESYMPGAVHDYAVKPLVLMQPDQTLEQSDASFYAGLFSEIFTYVPWGDHKKLWHEVWG